MKKQYLVLLICLAFFIQPSSAAVTMSFDNIVTKDNDTYLEINHIKLAGGTAEETAYALAKLGRDCYDAYLAPFINESYGREKMAYLASADPLLGEMSDGIREAYGIAADNFSYDFTYPVYDSTGVACSAVYIPPALSANGHALAARNYDWYATPQTTYSRNNAILELYKDRGYDTLAITTKNLLSGILDGMNEKGLYVTILTDHYGYTSNTPTYGGNSTGLHIELVLRSVLENCANVAEAKKRISDMENIANPGMHLFVGDAYGHAAVVDFDTQTAQPVFTETCDVPQIVTNHALRVQAPANLSADPHDTFVRYGKLRDYFSTQEGPYDQDDCFALMALVQADSDTTPEKTAAGKTIRTFWTVVSDLSTKIMTVRFYCADGGIISGTDPYYIHELVWSDDYTFHLQNDSRMNLYQFVFQRLKPFVSVCAG